MEQWRMTEPKIEGVVGEWFLAPNGGYVGIIIGDDGGVYTAKSDDCAAGVDPATIAKGTRVRLTPVTKGKGTDMETKAQYGWGTAREIVPIP